MSDSRARLGGLFFFSEFLVDRRRPLALFALALSLLLAAGLPRLEFVNDYRVFFDAADPQLLAHEALQDEYTRSDNVVLIVGVDRGTLYQPERLQALQTLTTRLWTLPRAIRVDSLINYQYSQASGDDMQVFALFEDPQALTDQEIAARRRLTEAEPLVVGNLVAPDGRTTLLNVRLEMPRGDSVEAGQATELISQQVRQIAVEFEQAHPDFTAHPQGLVIFDQAFHEETLQDLKTLAPAMFIAILLLLWLLLRSLGAMLAVLGVILLTVPAAMGAAGWLGMNLNQINVAAPTIMLTLCICDGVHILLSHQSRLREGAKPRDALIDALALNLQAVVLTTVTTAIGFACLNFSDSPPFRELGTIAAIGVMLALLFSLCSLPLLAARIAPPQSDLPLNRGMPQLAELVIRHHRPIVVGGLALALLLMSQAPRNELADSTVEYFHPDTAIRHATEYMESRLTGMDGISYSIPASEPGGIAEPAYLRQLAAFANWYATQPQVTHVSTFADVMRRLNRNMHGDDAAWNRLPESRELAAQYLLLYEMSLPYGLDLNDQVNFDKSATRMVVRMRNASSSQITATEARAQRWLKDNAPELLTPGVGVSLMFARIGENNIRSMLLGTAVALIGVSLALMLFLRSVTYGALSLVPNAFPALIALGIWGLAVGKVNLAVAAIFSITLGIVVDDTVHFLSKYLHARRHLGMDTAGGVRFAYANVGLALVVTTVTIGLGFGTLALSDFAVNALTGKLVALTVLIALVYDLLFLPALLLTFGPRD